MSAPRPMKARRKAQAGFTLVELLIVSTVFLIGVTGFLAVMIEARRSTAMARRDTEALALAEDLASQIELWRYDDPRLAMSPDPCRADPTDGSGSMNLHRLTPRDVQLPASSGNAFVRCAYGEQALTSGSFSGRGSRSFPTGTNSADQFLRMFVVREETADGLPPAAPNTGVRKRVWVVVAYADGRTAHKAVSYRTLVKREALR